MSSRGQNAQVDLVARQSSLSGAMTSLEEPLCKLFLEFAGKLAVSAHRMSYHAMSLLDIIIKERHLTLGVKLCSFAGLPAEVIVDDNTVYACLRYGLGAQVTRTQGTLAKHPKLARVDDLCQKAFELYFKGENQATFGGQDPLLKGFNMVCLLLYYYLDSFCAILIFCTFDFYSG